MVAYHHWRRLGQDRRRSCDVTTPTEGGRRQPVGLGRVDGSGATVGGGEEAERQVGDGSKSQNSNTGFLFDNPKEGGQDRSCACTYAVDCEFSLPHTTIAPFISGACYASSG